MKPRIELRLLVDPTAGPGRVARVGVLFTLDPGWHLYWRNPGEAGLPTKLQFEIEGARLGPIAWPAPEVFHDSDAGLTSYGYTDSVLLASDLVALPAGSARTLRAAADFLICKDQCIPGEVELTRDLDQALADGAAGAETARTHALFDAFAARVPQSAAALGVDVGVDGVERPARAGDPVRARLSVRGAIASAAFIPESSQAIATSDAQSASGSGPVTLAVEGADARLSGVLELRGRDGGVRFVALDLPLEADPPEPVAPASGAGSLLSALALALVGGLILNLMPCVLPVLALKAFGLAELGGRSRREVAAHAFGYVAGIEVTLLALAALVIALRAAGTYVGWGFQFQEPRFALAISLVLVGFALNLFGVFEIGAPTSLAGVGEQASGWRRSFFDGLLAVVLATPCSAPFLGTAVGFAFAGSAFAIALIFAAIGLGLAAPIAAVALVPATARFMPRSGPWMAKLRSALGFALLASACWTLWIFGSSTGVDALAARSRCSSRSGSRCGSTVCTRRPSGAGAASCWPCAIALAALVALRPLWRAPAQNVAATPAGDAADELAALRQGGDRRRAARRPAGLRRLHRDLVPDLRGERADRDRERAREDRARAARLRAVPGRLDAARRVDSPRAGALRSRRRAALRRLRPRLARRAARALGAAHDRRAARRAARADGPWRLARGRSRRCSPRSRSRARPPRTRAVRAARCACSARSCRRTRPARSRWSTPAARAARCASGDELDGATVVEIKSESVVLRRRGELETLVLASLSRSASTRGGDVPASAAPSDADAAATDSAHARRRSAPRSCAAQHASIRARVQTRADRRIAPTPAPPRAATTRCSPTSRSRRASRR